MIGKFAALASIVVATALGAQPLMHSVGSSLGCQEKIEDCIECTQVGQKASKVITCLRCKESAVLSYVEREESDELIGICID